MRAVSDAELVSEVDCISPICRAEPFDKSAYSQGPHFFAALEGPSEMNLLEEAARG